MAFKDILKKKTDDLSKIDGFNDPFARRIPWEQVKKRSGSAYKTHKAVVVNRSILKMQPTFFTRLLPWLVILFTLFLVFVFNEFRLDLRLYNFNNPDEIVQIGIIAFMLIMGLVTMFFSYRHIVFDRQLGFYHKGWKSMNNVVPVEKKNCARLDQIHAIQIISEIVRTKNSRYRSYELNLVLKSGNRINVVDHANQKAVREDAALISRFLNIPVWDVTI